MTTDASITGRSGKIYLFESCSINSLLFDPDTIGVSLFAQRIKDMRDYSPINEYIPKSKIGMYSEILNGEIISTAKEKGAQYFLHLTTQTKEEATSIIEDIKEDDTYKIKINDILP